MTSPPNTDSPYLIRQARRGEGAAVQKLLDRATPQDGVHRLIDGKTTVPEEHGLRLFGVAEDEDGVVCGAVSAGPMDAWIRNGAIPRTTLQDMTSHAVEMLALAVDPAHRGAKLGHRLTEWVEQVVAAAGYRVLLVRVDVDLTHLADYYGKAGFSLLKTGQPWCICPRPGGPFMIENFPDGSGAYKPLHPDVKAVALKGVVVLVGVVPGSEEVARQMLGQGV